jgi:hypothetical protein
MDQCIAQSSAVLAIKKVVTHVERRLPTAISSR